MYSVYASAKSGKCTYLQPTENTSKQACFVPAKSFDFYSSGIRKRLINSEIPESGNDI